MQTKKLKYQSYLEKFPNCPPDSFQPVDRDAYRWVHKEIIENDFLPLNMIKTPPKRVLDNTDNDCRGYGLSLFDSLDTAINRFLSLLKRSKPNEKLAHIEDKGDHVAFLKITKVDGVADLPNKVGHFTFHEYKNTFLADKIISLHPIFDNNARD